MTPLVVDPGDHVGGEVDDLLQVLRSEVQEVAQATGDTLEVPDVGNRSSEFDVPHALTANFGARHLDATTLTNDALEAHPLVLPAVALPVPRGPEDLLAEQSVLFRLQRPVVDGLRLLDLAVGPSADVISRREADTQVIEEVDVKHVDFLR